MLKNEFNNNASSIKEAINNDRLVVFAGAGVSKDSGIPLWNELQEGIRERLNEETSEVDPLKIAQLLYNEKGEKEYNDILKKLLFEKQDSPNQLHEILFELNPQHIITTNYDHHFESIINDHGLPFSIVSKDEDLPYASQKKLLIKYHGDFENHNIVLKENDYLEFSKNHTLKEVFVKSLFSNKVILFVGYSVSDPNLKLLIREIQYLLKKHHQRAYMLTSKEEVNATEIRYFESLGINIVIADKDLVKSQEKKNSKLSEIGLKAYKTLLHIRDFKVYDYRSADAGIKPNNSKIIDELYNSLARFHYIRVLPQKNLAGLYPIYKNAKQEPGYLVLDTSLKVFNEDLYQLISEYKGKDDDNFSDDEKEKLNYSLSRIAMSGIHTIGHAGNIDSMGSYPIKDEMDFHKKINYSSCDCIDCTLNDYDYSTALNKIFKYNIDDKTSLWDDLIYFYGLYRTKDFYNCFLALRNIIVKANRLKKMEVSFLAKYNLKQLKWLIRNDFLNDRINWKDIQDIEKQIDKIDLDEELDKAKYFVDEDLYSFLKEVRDGVYIQRLCNEIDEIFVKVPKTVESIEKGGSHSSNVFGNLYNSVSLLKEFLEGNFLLGNGFSPIQYTLNKSINSFVLGYYLKNFAGIKKHSFLGFGLAHITEFDTFLFKLIVENSNHKELVQILAKNKIKNIQIGKKSSGQITSKINNFLKSSYKIPKYFGKEPVEDRTLTSTIVQNRSLREHMIEKINGILIVMSYFDLNEHALKTIYSNLNHYINFVGIGDENYSYLTRFYKRKFEFIDETELVKTLDLFDGQSIINDAYMSILDALRKKNKNFTRDIPIDNYDLNKHSPGFSTIFKILPPEKKKDFKKILKTKLVEEMDGQMFYISISNKVLATQEIKTHYKKLISKKLELNMGDSDVDDSFVLFRIKQFFDLVNKGLIDTKGIDVKSISEERFRFLLNPERFSQQNFRTDWLKYFNWDSYCERYAKLEYIILALERSLESEFDEKLSRVYFKMKKWIK
ncbi:SIR2 family protein [Flagellimonas algicola]|uniref:SIR2-like protein n=1 Tax=Flagellimonas algicola TaxID=2583815 RepID=A0ABY2WJJ2_9FLAO|nr:SIR2 family protein [Allomuricauda algicola]TMU54589.1 hypothetical protein FGG15_10265 [Allomuricauda algicola]